MKLETAAGRDVIIDQRVTTLEKGIYSVASLQGVLFKAYRSDILTRDPTLERRLRAMVANPPEDWRKSSSGHAALEWPLQIVLDGGRFAGYLMPQTDISSVDLDVVTYPGILRREGGSTSWVRDFTWKDRIHTAADLAHSTHLLHRNGTVIGDFTPSVARVTPDAQVTLVECDDMQFTDPASGEQFLRRYFSAAGSMYCSPELESAQLAIIARHPSSDLFALAIHIYQLLVEGRHPFYGDRQRSGNQPSMGEMARQEIWTQQRNSMLHLLPEAIIDMFRAAFDAGAHNPAVRPTADDWQRSLIHLADDTVGCADNPSHQYWSGLHTCPWCSQTGAERGALTADAVDENLAKGANKPPAKGRASGEEPRDSSGQVIRTVDARPFKILPKPHPGRVYVLSYRDGHVRAFHGPPSPLDRIAARSCFIVDASEQHTSSTCTALSASDAYSFSVELSASWRVSDPEAAVQSGGVDLERMVLASLEDSLRQIARRFQPGEFIAAEAAARSALARQFSLGSGITMLRAMAKFQADAAVVPATGDTDATRQQDVTKGMRMSQLRELFDRTEADAVMMHLLQHPHDTGMVLSALEDNREQEQAMLLAAIDRDRQHYLGMLDRALENNLLTDADAQPLRDFLIRQALDDESSAAAVPGPDHLALTLPGVLAASGDGGRGSDTGRALPPAEPPRYLKGQCPDSVRVGDAFSVLASIVRIAPDMTGSVQLKAFTVEPEGEEVLLVLHAPGLRVLSEQRQVVHVPAGGDSEPVMFEVQPYRPGPCRLSITAWRRGSYLGELIVETVASAFPVSRGRHRDFVAGIDTMATEGAVSLVVRYDRVQNAYRFEFRDEDNPAEVTSNLAYDPGERLEQLVAGLDQLAKGRSGYSPAEARDYLMNAGVGLWRDLVPAQLREQFWERQQRIRQLTILADSDAVPWELLYPLDGAHGAGFLVEQFPVTRIVFGRRPSRRLNFAPARLVLPDNSPQQARDEVGQLNQLLGLRAEEVIGELTPLLELIRSGDFGLLHFACHNAFDPVGGSAITLDKRLFTPTQLNTAAAGRLLERSAPTVFINACRSAGVSPSYHQLDGWARQFLEAGAAAFIGSLWAVRDTAAREFATELYQNLRAGHSLGEAVMRARKAAAGDSGDPTWLAYAVYGDPRATIG